MEGIAWLGLTIIISIVLFVALCKCTTMISFDGVEGLAKGYLSNLLWVLIISAGISAFILYAIEGVIGFFIDILFNEMTWIVVGLIYCAYCLFSRSHQMKGIKKDLDKDKRFYKKCISLPKDENGKIPLDLYYIDSKRMIRKGNGLAISAVKVSLPENNTSTVNQIGYRVITFTEKEDNVVSYGVLGPKDDNDINMSTFRPKEDLKENETVIDTLFKLSKGKENIKTLEVGHFTKGDESNYMYLIYKYTNEVLGDLITVKE